MIFAPSGVSGRPLGDGDHEKARGAPVRRRSGGGKSLLLRGKVVEMGVDTAAADLRAGVISDATPPGFSSFWRLPLVRREKSWSSSSSVRFSQSVGPIVPTYLCVTPDATLPGL